ncbi:hypothetical protein [Parendozoicomonas haliclonae]|uniref:Uncharacterized protein n=1 Tax=Parendozoicomonas haliclonae TaxID=1960125 RepID=A0A1X7AMQ1_9GAMM|nr:hypothetical protein [Parendozoicomonas haliclonae]SMA49324.1 hypothetical protein EHSB41UT_03187 [Parendozoicomonas haliclonae]
MNPARPSSHGAHSSRFDGFYFDGRYFEAAWDANTVSWFCHEGCGTRLEIPMARLWSQKLGKIPLSCPACNSAWQLEISSLSPPLSAEIIETDPSASPNNLFPH